MELTVQHGKRLRVFGVDCCLSKPEVKKLDYRASQGRDGEMAALKCILREAEKISAPPTNGNGHNGHKAKKPSKTATTARISRAPFFRA